MSKKKINIVYYLYQHTDILLVYLCISSYLFVLFFSLNFLCSTMLTLNAFFSGYFMVICHHTTNIVDKNKNDTLCIVRKKQFTCFFYEFYHQLAKYKKKNKRKSEIHPMSLTWLISIFFWVFVGLLIFSTVHWRNDENGIECVQKWND